MTIRGSIPICILSLGYLAVPGLLVGADPAPTALPDLDVTCIRIEPRYPAFTPRMVDGVPRSVYDVLGEPRLASLLSDEGRIADARRLMGIESPAPGLVANAVGRRP